MKTVEVRPLQFMGYRDRRSIRGVDEAIVAIEKNPALFAQLIEDMQSDDPLMRMRSADLATQDPALAPQMMGVIEAQIADVSLAVPIRGKKLLAQLSDATQSTRLLD